MIGVSNSVLASCTETWSGASSGTHPAVGTDPAAGEEVQQRDRLQQAVAAARSRDSVHHAVLFQEGDQLYGAGSRARPKRARQGA